MNDKINKKESARIKIVRTREKTNKHNVKKNVETWKKKNEN